MILPQLYNNLQVVVKTKSRHRVLSLSSSLKQIARSVSRSRRSIALQTMKDSSVRRQVMCILNCQQYSEGARCNVQFEVPINAEKIRFVCTESLLMGRLQYRVEKTAPNLFALLNGILHVHSPPSQRKRRKSDKLCRVNKNAILGFCAALLCRYRKQSMNLVQRLISMNLVQRVIPNKIFATHKSKEQQTGFCQLFMNNCRALGE